MKATYIFKTVIALTVVCGLLAFVIAVLPVAYPGAESTPFLDPMFKTLTFLFSTGVAAIFGMITSKYGVGP